MKINKILFLLFILFASNHFAENESIEVFLQGKKISAINNDGVDIWVATEGDGIFKYVKWKDEWINYSSANNKIKQDFFYCIEVGPRYIWAGSADGLYTFDKKRNRWNRRRFALGGQFSNWIRSLKYDKKENKLWIGRFKYLTQFDLITKKYTDFDLTKDKNDKTNSIKTIDLDGDSLIWIGVEAGIHKYDKSDSSFSTTFYDSRTNFFQNEGDQVSVTDILFEQNNIWLGTDEFKTPENPNFNLGGLFKYDRGIKWNRFDEFNKLSGSGIYSIELTGNFIWTSVYSFDSESKEMNGKGLNLINRKTMESKIIDNNLLPDTIYSLHYDGQNMWLGTNDGIRKISLTNLLVADFN